MRADHKDTRISWNTVELWFKHSLIEADKLRDECHIGVCDWSSFFNVRERLIKSHFVLENQVRETYSGTTRDTLDTVNIHLPILSLSLLDKVDSIIEYAFDLFSDVVL